MHWHYFFHENTQTHKEEVRGRGRRKGERENQNGHTLHKMGSQLFSLCLMTCPLFLLPGLSLFSCYWTVTCWQMIPDHFCLVTCLGCGQIMSLFKTKLHAYFQVWEKECENPPILSLEYLLKTSPFHCCNYSPMDTCQIHPSTKFTPQI